MVIVIAPNIEPESKNLTLQDFVIEGQNVIPFFLDGDSFNDQIRGSGFERDGIEIDTHVLAGVLRGVEVFVLNPGGEAPQRFGAGDLIAAWTQAS